MALAHVLRNLGSSCLPCGSNEGEETKAPLLLPVAKFFPELRSRLGIYPKGAVAADAKPCAKIGT